MHAAESRGWVWRWTDAWVLTILAGFDLVTSDELAICTASALHEGHATKRKYTMPYEDVFDKNSRQRVDTAYDDCNGLSYINAEKRVDVEKAKTWLTALM